MAVLGYGSQGRAMALNLRDSGYKVIVALKSGSRSRSRARKDGFREIYTAGKAVKNADIICFALPDHLHGKIFRKEIEKNLEPGKTLLFLHGFSVHFGYVTPPGDCDVIMIAPHGPGIMVREKFLSEKSMSAFYAIHQNHSGEARRRIFELAQSLGFGKSKLVRSNFADEAVGDTFGEQAVLCGGLSELILNGFEVLVEKGLPPENAYLEVAYQLDLIIDLIKKYGIEGMYDRISVTARVGSVASGKKIIGRSVKQRMRQLYDDIESGRFAQKLGRLNPQDVSRVRRLIKSRVPASFEKSAKKYSK